MCPSYKIIVLDEADLMTKDAQSALRRVIEDSSGTTRFCIICNYITKYWLAECRIIDPVASRCVKFRFKPIPREAQLGKLKEICRAENVRLDETDLVNLLEKGDLRQSINSLQSFHSLRIVPLNLLPTPSEYCKQIINAVFTASSVKQVYHISKWKLIQGKEMGFDEYPMDEVLTGFIDVINHTES
jgi:DNA polymerase III delta prime subunit